MALTDQEKHFAEYFLKYYSGDLNGLPKDVKKTEAFIYGTEEEKKTIIKAFIADVILPREKVQKNAVESNLTTITNRIADLESYTKGT